MSIFTFSGLCPTIFPADNVLESSVRVVYTLKETMSHTKEMKQIDTEEDESDFSVIEIPMDLDKDLEVIFNSICYDVRTETDKNRFKEETTKIRNYGVELIREINRRKDSGDLNPDEYEYCLKAANEIMQMEMIFFQKEFEDIEGPYC